MGDDSPITYHLTLPTTSVPGLLPVCRLTGASGFQTTHGSPTFVQKYTPFGFGTPLPGHKALARRSAQWQDPRPLRTVGLLMAEKGRNPLRWAVPTTHPREGLGRPYEMQATGGHPAAVLSPFPETPRAGILWEC